MTARRRRTRSQEAKRYSELAEQEYVTAQQYDQSRTAAAAAAATRRAASQAAVAEARLNLQYATIRAPISGRTGSLRVREGNLVRASDATPLVTINQIRPILVRFAVPAANLALIQKHAGREAGGAGRAGGRRTGPSEGTLTFVDNAVDTTTGTILLKGSFPNDGRRALAGRVRERAAPALRRPERAHGPGHGGGVGPAGQLRLRDPAGQHGGDQAGEGGPRPPATSPS